jgi:hypothetical protein
MAKRAALVTVTEADVKTGTKNDDALNGALNGALKGTTP